MLLLLTRIVRQVGIGLKPGTDVSAVLPYAELADMLLVMTVEPGFGGQKFMADMMPKVAQLREAFPLIDIEVDGGVSPATIDQCAKVSEETGAVDQCAKVSEETGAIARRWSRSISPGLPSLVHDG